MLAAVFSTQAQKAPLAPDPPPAPTPAATPIPPPIDALLYKVSGNGLKTPSYVFGTMHMICQNDMLPMDKLTVYFDQTEQLVMELDMDDPAEVNAMSGGFTLPDGKKFIDMLTPDEMKKADAFLRHYIGIPVEQVKTFKPLIVQTMVLASPRIIGCFGPGSYETSLTAAAAAKKKQILGLETAAFQMAVLDKTPLDKQIKDLNKMVAEPDKYVSDFKNLLAVYKTQSSEGLMAEMNRQMTEDKDFQTRLLDDRNKDWIPKIEAKIKEKATFIAVGGGHLGGKMGVIALLKAKGYKVEPIRL